MPLQLIQLHKCPERIAATKVGSVVTNGTFFLDFSRPLNISRWFGIHNSIFGLKIWLLVPVIHKSENSGEFVIGVYRNDPYFKEILGLWKNKYPTKNPECTLSCDGLQIIADFAKQFPEDCQ